MCCGIANRYSQLMEEAVALSMDHVHEGGIPFNALVVDRNGKVLGRSVIRVRENDDPTARAEVDALPDACRRHGTSNLLGATLQAAGQPCPMCYMSALIAGIGHVVFAADRNEAAEHGFDYRSTYRLFAEDPVHWEAPSVEKLGILKRLEPFQAFRSRLGMI